MLVAKLAELMPPLLLLLVLLLPLHSRPLPFPIPSCLLPLPPIDIYS